MLRRNMPDELILTGRPEHVNQLISKAAAQESGLGEHRSVQMNHNQTSLKFGLARVNRAHGAGSTSNLLLILGQVAKAARLNVAMEPNCAVGNPSRSELNPWDWELDPWDWELDPWDWELDPALPYVIPVGNSPAEGESLFWRQPAFQQIGLVDALGQRKSALTSNMGTGVMVGIFDAKPSKPVVLPWLTIHPSAEPIQSPNTSVGRNVSDHGLMCASLIHAVAPEAEIHLYEVCAGDGYGTLYPLLQSLAAFVETAAASGKPAVLSLSLGTICATGPSPALRAILQKATDLGMVVCAASGNKAKSAAKVCTLPAAQEPASLPNVIAVAATNLSSERASYSQRGDIAAPGGEDVGPHGPGDADDIIGMGVSVGTTGYVAMDAGTSFSTPLVAGAAALLLQAKLAGGGSLSAGTFNDVLASLVSSAHPVGASTGETLRNTGLGAGILNLTGLLA